MPDTPTDLEPGGVNPIGRMLGLLGDEWSLLILQQSLTGAVRYRDFVARLPISNSVLTNRLGTLTESGLLNRRPVDGTGRTAYLPTRRAKSLWPVLLSIWEWERTWVTGHTGPSAGHAAHHRCGQQFTPALRCRACRGTVASSDVRITAGPSADWDRSAPQSSTRRRSETPGPARHAGLFPETMAVFGNRWSAALLVAAFLGATRYTDFSSRLGIPPSLLAELTADVLLDRCAHLLAGRTARGRPGALPADREGPRAVRGAGVRPPVGTRLVPRAGGSRAGPHP